MKRKSRHSHSHSHDCCQPPESFPHKVLPAEKVMEMPIIDDVTFTLKVLYAAYCILAQEHDRQVAADVLNDCAWNISCGHIIEFR